MIIVADRSIPFIEGVFEPYGEVRYLDGHSIGRKDIADADALLIRTRTKCNAGLLEGSPVRIIATTSIGTDHIDQAYCRKKGIYITNASGCNAGGVMNYVLSALYGTAARKSISLEGATLGIIGVGNSGKKIEHAARLLGFKLLLCDPPRAEKEGESQFCSLQTLLENSDIVTMHVPLTESTRKMADAAFFSKMKPGAFFINSSRGEIVDEDDLEEALPKLGPVVIDTWNNEPDINIRLMNKIDIATPHIAGYSQYGKQTGAAYAVRSIARYFSIQPLLDYFPKTENDELEVVKLDIQGKSQGQIASIIQYNYPIFTDDFMFRMNPSGFKEMRSSYKYRKEFFIDF